MRDTGKIFRQVIYQALNGNITYNSVQVPLFDEKRSVTSTANLFILFGTQREVANDTDDAFMTNVYLDLEIHYKTGSEISKDALDDVANSILTILFPTAWSFAIVQPSLMQIQNLRRESSITRTIELSPTESVVRKIITLKAIAIQQF